MTEPKRVARSQRMIMVSGVLIFTILLVVLQLWLLTATMNAFLGGDNTTAVPAALASITCFGINLWLLRHLYRWG